MTTVDYTVVVGDTECTIVELSETASLADARTEIELDAVDILEIPRDFLFLYKGIKCPPRKEQTRKVADVTGQTPSYGCINHRHLAGFLENLMGLKTLQ